MVNKPGYSQHLVGVTIMLARMIGSNDGRLGEAARRLASKNPGNAFFAYLSEGRSDSVRQKTLGRCPSPEKPPTRPLMQWQWERDDSDRAWERSCYWDCIFMAQLLTQ